MVESGYAPCACRDCCDIAISDDIARPDLCWACEEAGCSREGDGECSRADAYGCEEDQDDTPRSPFALLDDALRTIVRNYEHTDAERDEYARRCGRRYVYLPLGGQVGDAVTVDDDGEATVVREELV